MLFRADGHFTIYQHHNEHYAANCVLEHDHFGGCSVMVWAEIHHDGRTALVRVNGALNAQIYQVETLQHHGVPLTSQVASFSMTMPGHTLHKSAESFCSKTM